MHPDPSSDSPSTGNSAGAGDSLQPYQPGPDKPWNAQRVAHLYRRLGFGATHAQIEQGLQMQPVDLVDQLLDAAAALPPPVEPYWANYTDADYNGNFDLVTEHRLELRQRWLSDMLDEGVRAKMALFWHNHFVTEQNVYGCNMYMWQYYNLLHNHAFGNFRDFALAIGKTPAMLVYLNGNQNVAGEPNENYARELMELFTMGESNGYTQADIVDMARALTGWRANRGACTAAFYDPALHDDGVKTIFGQTGNFNFDEAHQLMFQHRQDQVAHFIARKLYRHFVRTVPDTAVVEGLAALFKASDWEILPVVRTLIRSEHFFEASNINAMVKSPYELMMALYKMSGADSQTHIKPEWWNAAADFWTYLLGQLLFDPPGVAGWPGHRAWINENALTFRWQFARATNFNIGDTPALRENLRNLAIALSNDSNDPAVIVPALVEFFLRQPLEPLQLAGAIENFKANVPSNYFEDGTWNLYYGDAPFQIRQLLDYLVQLPEFQLN